MFKQWTIPATDITSLVWEGDTLVDWAGGARRFGLDGSVKDRSIIYAYRFDAAAISPSGEYVALITRTGTKALLLRRGEVVRQLNRDFYHAEAYPYPLTFATSPAGRDVVIHCPESYCQIEIEDVASGDRIACTGVRKPADFFVSGLSVSPSGRWLLSAGWVWHPVHVANFYDLGAAFSDSSALDNPTAEPPGRWGIGSAAFIDDATAMVGTMDEFFGDENDPTDDIPGKHSVGVWQIGSGTYLRAIKLPHPPGTLMPIGDDHVVTFYDHPRLYDLRTGGLIAEWQIDSGKQTGSITWDNLPPPIALHPTKPRFAVASAEAIQAIEIDVPLLGAHRPSRPRQ